MKKIILLAIILTKWGDVSFASFPIHSHFDTYSDTLQTEEIKLYHYSLQRMGINLSSCKCISCRNGINPIVTKPKPLPIKLENIIEEEKREPSGGLYVLLSTLSEVGSLFFGFLSLGHALSHNGSYSWLLLFFMLTLSSVVGSFILAIKAKKQGVHWSLAILSVGIAVLAILLLFPIFSV